MKTRLISTFSCTAALLTSSLVLAQESDVSGTITTKLHGFDFTKGTGTSRTSFLERYYTRKGWGGGDRHGGFFLDVDLQLKIQLAENSVLTIDRWGDGQYRQGGVAAWDKEAFQVSAKYDFLRTSTGGLSYLFSPAVVEGSTNPAHYFPARTNTASGYLAQFNDYTDRKVFYVDRFSYGAGFQIKPDVLGEATRIQLEWDGYSRKGEKMQSMIFGGSDLSPTTDRALARWRSFTKRIDEMNNRLRLSVTLSPGDLFNLAYTGVLEKFDNRAADFLHRDIPLQAPFFIGNPANELRPVNFVPDSTLVSHSLRVTKQLASTRLTAGAHMADLEQDSFTPGQIALGYDTGEVRIREAFGTADTQVSRLIRLQGHVKYGSRKNASSFPVVGLIDNTASSRLGVRLNEIESFKYGLSATMRPTAWRSTVVVGWEAENKDRDLTFSDAGITPSVSLLKGDTTSDKVFVRTNTRLNAQTVVRAAVSYLWADKTGTVIEPSKGLGIKTALVYTTPKGSLVTMYYDWNDTENDNNSFTDKGVADPRTYYQNIDNTNIAAGLSYDFKASDEVDARMSLNWARQDASVRFFETNRRRYEANPIFNIRDYTGSSIEVYVLSLGAVWKFSPQLHFDAAYDLTLTDGHLATGEVARELSKVDDTLDNAIHTFSVGTTYFMSETMRLRVNYLLEDYSDSAYSLLSARAHMVTFALSVDL